MVNLKTLLQEYEKYDDLHWFSLKCFKKFYQYLFSQRSAIAAPNLVNAIVNTEEKNIDPTELAKQLVSKNVNIQYLISEMNEKGQSFDKIFEDDKLIGFLEEFEKEYINKERIREDQRQIAEGLFMSLPINIRLNGCNKSHDNNVSQYINNSSGSNLIIKTLFNHLDVKEISQKKWNSCNNIKAKILAYDKLQSYQFFYSQFAKLYNAGDNISYNSGEKLNHLTQEVQLELIKEWFNPDTNTKNDLLSSEKGYIQESTPWFAWLRGYKPLNQRLLNALQDTNLIGSGYEKSISEYVGRANADKKDQAIKDAISEAYKEIVGDAKTGKADIISTTQLVRVLSTTEAIIKNLKNINSNPRLQRIFKELVLKGLNDSKTKDAAAIIMGNDSVKNMIDVISADIDNELLAQITPLMSGTIEDIEAKYNLKPGYVAKIGKGYNQITGYPEWAFFKVVDFVTMLIEYIVEFTKRGLYKPYELITGCEEANKRQNQEILLEDNIKNILQDLKGHLQDKKSSAGIQNIPQDIPQEEQSKNAIINYLKDSNTGKDKLQQIIKDIIKDRDISSYNKSELYQLYKKLDKQSIGSYAKMLDHQSKSITILGL